MKRHFFALFLLASVGAAGLHGQSGASSAAPQSEPSERSSQQPPVTFRAEVNYVEVDARVSDAEGKFVTGLLPTDFQVFEDGKPQKVTVFSLVNIPVERAQRPLFASKPIEPDVQSNVRGYDGRVFVLVLDDLHTHPLRSAQVKQAARRFVERHLGANDTVAVVHTGGPSDASQDFTNNQRLVLNAIDRFMGRKLGSSVLEAVDRAQVPQDLRPGERIEDPLSMERGYNARNTLNSLKQIAEFMADLHGRRKAIVFFSEGIDYDITDVFRNREASAILDASRETIAAATRANVAIYAVDARGLTMSGDELIEVSGFPKDEKLGLSAGALYNEVQRGQDNLRLLAEETGGFAAVNTNDLRSAFERVVEANSSYYILGYYPTNDRRDGRFRKIEVRVNRPGLTVRARRGYVAARGRASEAKLAGPNDASAELREALTSPLPVSELSLAVTAAIFRGAAPNASVVISTLVGARDLGLTEKDGTFRNDLELGVVAVNPQGKTFVAPRSTINLMLKPDTVARLRAGGFRVVSSIDLPPGRYQMRVAVREGNGRHAGSVLYDLEVPDFSKEQLSMSSIALTSASSRVPLTARPKDPLANLLPAPLTSYREFPQNDELAVFAEIYDAAVKQPHKVGIALTVNAEGGHTVFQTREERDSAELAGKPGGYGFTARIPLSTIAPGLYVMRVEAQSRIGDRPMVARELVFRVTAPLAATPGAGAAASSPTQPTASMSITTLANDLMSGVDMPREAVARTSAEFDRLWQAHAAGRQPPSVDFARHMVIAVFLGSRPSGGYQAQITGARLDGDTLVVRWTERQPGPGTVSAQVITAPAHLAAVPRHDGRVRFEKVESPPGD